MLIILYSIYFRKNSMSFSTVLHQSDKRIRKKNHSKTIKLMYLEKKTLKLMNKKNVEEKILK
jgi:hypothetical protein